VTSLCPVTVNVISANCDNNNQLQLPSQVDHKKVTSRAAERLLKSSRENSEKGGQEWKISNEAHCIYPVPSTRCLKDYNCTERDTKRELKMSWLTHKGGEQGKLCPRPWENSSPNEMNPCTGEKDRYKTWISSKYSLKTYITIIYYLVYFYEYKYHNILLPVFALCFNILVNILTK